jgi:hypothetical protein
VCPRSLHVEPCSNESVVQAFGAAAHPYWLTSGQCSCDLVPSPPSDDAQPKAGPSLEVRLRRKYERRGWTKAKIDRAVADSLAASASPTLPPGFRQDVAEMLSGLAKRFGRVQVIVHWFDGPLDVRLTLRQGRKIPVASLISEPVEYDQCHEIVVGAGLTTP